ncbi:hypothetical protein [Enterococcus hermanniensis]|uniref:Uncharacterized protein n=1 Tax=Enterococcus hermanniensis TaxID=249189 RepID=A0A1L8TPZ2_9ENTE|nr:hypothetical protein [Enterococcus hermanniensis]OJG46386.1 hypothetical protein RV04_GL000814 [Enterococcus hermanniensis]
MDKTNERILFNNLELQELKKIILYSLNEGYSVYYPDIELTKMVITKLFSDDEFKKINREFIVE